ncbi:ABC transporter ATP-binding protein, partial [Pelagibacteraceae bacterium]|nr:ABC transporter ATP-binding protein [Pelagibacteraceae bacterium]
HVYIEKILKDLSLWDKKDSKIKELSGGMKRRVLIAKALSHEPKILFLDEPTASVDVELRKDMWDVVKKLNKNGVTIILTTHYIEEAEELSDRVAIINDGKIILVEEKNSLIKKLGEKTIKIELTDKIEKINGNLSKYNFVIDETKKILTYSYNLNSDDTDLTGLLNDIKDEGLILKDIITEQSSLEEIFIKLIKENNELVRN